MKQTLLITFIILSLLLSPSLLWAKNYKMIFWYPGEAGSTSEAAPILATLFEYLGTRVKGATFSGKYINTTHGGITYINNQRPHLGILSWIALAQNRAKLPPNTTILKTLPLPYGSSTERFTLVGTADGTGDNWRPPQNLTIYSSIPVGRSFFTTRLAPEIQTNITLQTTDALFMTLKRIASEKESSSVALLTPTEGFTLKNLKSDWAKGLVTLYRCRSIPSAPLVVFGQKPEITEELKKVLLSMSSDPEGRQILDSLRLKGFAK